MKARTRLELPYEEIFTEGDTITLHAEKVEYIDRCLWDCKVAIDAQSARIGERSSSRQTLNIWRS